MQIAGTDYHITTNGTEKALVKALRDIVALDDGDCQFAWKHHDLFNNARAALTRYDANNN